MFKQEIPKLGLSIQRGTDAVPADGQYHVILSDEIIHSSRSEKQALEYYRSKRDELLQTVGPVGDAPPDQDDVLRRIRTEGDIYAVRADAFQRREGLSNRKGGRGGRGGV